ncbi:MAG: glycosyltransferase family 2 protein, partial [Armatimonadota bacterium]
MTLSIILISYNTRDLLRNCLQSVFSHPPSCEFVVTVVDNASADGSAQMVQTEFPQVRVIANESNLGYAAAINQALRGLSAEYALILNSDIEVAPKSLDALLAFMEDTPLAGMCAPQLFLPDGSAQATWRRGFSLGQFAAQQLLVAKLFCRAGACTPPSGPVEHLDGAALLVRAEALRQVGLMDEGYWLYCEDSDWCLRFRRAGWELHYVAHARILHHHGA